MQSEPLDASRDDAPRTLVEQVDRFGTPAQPPIHSIPYELLAEIMLCVLPNSFSHSNSDLDGTTPTAQVLRLCSICERWRQVALNTPLLWALQYFPLISFNEKISVPLNELFLERSEPLPITVSFSQVVPPAQVIAKLVSVAKRWKDFRMVYGKIPAVFGSDFLAAIAAAGVHSMEKIHLMMPWPALASQLDIFKHAPRLRRVNLEAHDTVQWKIPSFPWAQLTSLTLEHPLPQVCLDIIVRCEKIVDVSVLTVQCQPRHCRRVVNHMKELRLFMRTWSQFEGDPFDPILRGLELPELKSLDLSLAFPGVDDQSITLISRLPSTLNDFLAKTPRLESLTLIDCVVPEDVPEILRHVPSLTYLYLDVLSTGPVDDEFFEALRYDPTAPAVALLPKLEIPELVNVGFDFDEESLAEMIESRWWLDKELASLSTPPGVVRLKQVRFNNDDLECPPFTKAFTWRMKRLRSQGLSDNRACIPEFLNPAAVDSLPCLFSYIHSYK